MNPLVSVVMPVYNGEKYVEDAVNSILRQTFKDFEFIIIDDCSIDQTPQILNSFNDPRIRIHKNEKNLKIAHSLNKGMELARGKYIARMDADDISYPDRFLKQVNFLESYPTIGLVGTGIQLFGEINRKKLRPESPEENQIRLFFQTCCTHPAIMFEKSVAMINNIFYSNEYVPTEDYFFIFNMSKHTQIYNLQEILLKYRTFSQNVTKQKYQNRRDNLGRRIRQHIFEHYKISLTEKQLDLHNKLSQRENTYTNQKLDSLLEYTEHINNELSKIFDPSIVRNELKFQWMGFLNQNKRLKFLPWYLKNILHPNIRPDIQIIKQVIQRTN